MLAKLHETLPLLPALIRQRTEWNSLEVVYDKPRVERLWRQLGDHRLALHRIHSCEKGESLLHPHPWPSAVIVLSGVYEMGVGYSETDEVPDLDRVIHWDCSTRGTFEYEMVNPHEWHYVRPVGGVCMSVMLSGPPWGRSAPKGNTPQPALKPGRRRSMFNYFVNRFPPVVEDSRS